MMIIDQLSNDYKKTIKKLAIDNFQYYFRKCAQPDAVWEDIITYLTVITQGFFDATDSYPAITNLTELIAKNIKGKCESHFSPIRDYLKIDDIYKHVVTLQLERRRDRIGGFIDSTAEFYICPTMSASRLLCYIRISSDDFKSWEVKKINFNIDSENDVEIADYLAREIYDFCLDHQRVEADKRSEPKEVIFGDISRSEHLLSPTPRLNADEFNRQVNYINEGMNKAGFTKK